ncbi:MAG: DNA repair protein RecO [Firmicutes bacterium]|nr:DNA repair protein RecO [Bacillota bacterium]
MSKRKVRGIVIEASNKGENDRWLTVLCKDLGKISVKARACRKPNAKLFGCSALFSYCDFIIDDHLQFYQLLSGEPLTHFFVGCDDIKKLALANYFVSMTNKMLKHGQEDNEFMYFLLKALQALDKDINDIRTIGYIFEIRSLVILGFMPYMEGCIACGAENTGYFTPEGMVCPACAKDGDIRLTPETCLALSEITACDADKVFRLKYNSAVKKQLSDCARIMMNYYMNTSFHTYNVMGYVKWY